ncbi:RidA family protein [Pacificimonas sp. WHA3]|uniref:RidA family protein n=1 Tax=Pacificimonas pallii TaxID=2827236 RepID=A0ABS6SH37_9SPHN|nr:RidA family protein [Pacificimonas pallii]MBV7257734.1 RidA family protein [Pacificimonas pallii]
MTIEEKLNARGLTLPAAPAAAANYVPFVKAGGLLHIAGQIPFDANGELMCGTVGDTVTTDEAYAIAQRCALAILAQTKAALGSLEAIRQVVKLNVFVASVPGYTEQPKVANGASDLLAEILGEPGRHARSAVGVAALPLGVAVEIDAVIEFDAD